MDPLTVGLASGAVSAVGSWLSGDASAKASEKAAKIAAAESAANRAEQIRQFNVNRADIQTKLQGAQNSLRNYGYTEYQNPLLSQYLSGTLSPAQQAVIAQNQRVGEAGIARRSASMGMPSGAQGALYGQLSRDISLGAGQLAGQQQQIGLQYSIGEWARRQEAANRQKELMASYAPY